MNKYIAIKGFNVPAPPGWRGKGEIIDYGDDRKELRFEPGDTFNKLPEDEYLEILLKKGTIEELSDQSPPEEFEEFEEFEEEGEE